MRRELRDDTAPGQDGLGRILGRDGFSPDLPAALARKTERTSLGLRLLLYMLRGIRIGSLDLSLPNGQTLQIRGALPGPHGVMHIRSGRFIRHVLRSGEVGVGDAYLDECWDSPDLTSLLRVLYLNEPHYKGPFEKNWLGRLHGWWQHRRRANTRRGAASNVEHHYDLGNAFYKLWLDETLAYSSAIFSRPDESMATSSGVFLHGNETLEQAQLNKFRLMLQRLDLKPTHRLLEIGSGWGGFAIYAAQHAGCRVTSITLSKEQLAEARLRAQSAGVADRVSFELRDYRDVAEQYDRVVSIEMYEAVGEAYWPAYFGAIARALKPGGVAAIQGITIGESLFEQYRYKRDFIQKYIFPGGMLCTQSLFRKLAADAGLAASDLCLYARDYADTLAHWHRNVLAASEAIIKQFDERFLRMWRYYLAYCECGFRTGSIDLMQISLHKT